MKSIVRSHLIIARQTYNMAATYGLITQITAASHLWSHHTNYSRPVTYGLITQITAAQSVRRNCLSTSRPAELRLTSFLSGVYEEQIRGVAKIACSHAGDTTKSVFRRNYIILIFKQPLNDGGD